MIFHSLLGVQSCRLDISHRSKQCFHIVSTGATTAALAQAMLGGMQNDNDLLSMMSAGQGVKPWQQTLHCWFPCSLQHIPNRCAGRDIAGMFKQMAHSSYACGSDVADVQCRRFDCMSVWRHVRGLDCLHLPHVGAACMWPSYATAGQRKHTPTMTNPHNPSMWHIG